MEQPSILEEQEKINEKLKENWALRGGRTVRELVRDANQRARTAKPR